MSDTVTQMMGRTGSEILDCVLTEDEQRDRGRQLAEVRAAIDLEVDAQATARKAMKERLDDLESESTRLAEIVREGKEPRPVAVRIEFDDTKGLVHKIRQDTGELIATRTMTEDEKQRAPRGSQKVN